MTTPCRDRVTAAVVTLLAGLSALVPGLRVERERGQDWQDDELPAIAVYDGDQVQHFDVCGQDDYVLTLDIEAAAIADSEAAAASALDTLRARVWQAVGGGISVDGSFVAVELAPEAPPRRLDIAAHRPARGAVLSLALTYSTAENDPFTFA